MRERVDEVKCWQTEKKKLTNDEQKRKYKYIHLYWFVLFFEELSRQFFQNQNTSTDF